MLGFAESFNLSVSTAVTLAYINSLGGLKHGDLSSDEREKVGSTSIQYDFLAGRKESACLLRNLDTQRGGGAW